MNPDEMLTRPLTPEEIALRDAEIHAENEARGGPLPVVDRCLENLLDEVEQEEGFWEDRAKLIEKLWPDTKAEIQPGTKAEES